MSSTRTIRHGKPSEEGFILLTAIFLLALLVLALSVAAPRMAKEIQRDREVETMQRGKQYQRAIQLYYRKFGAYPPNINALVKTSNIRFLRKRYIDPMTGTDDWKPIHWGQNKTPTAMGFFGQPLAGSTLAGTGPSGGNTAAGTGLTSSSATGTGIGSSSLFSSTDSSTSATTSASSSGTAAGTATGSSDTTGGSSSGSSTGLSGQTFGGAGIIGFSPGSPKQSILTYKKKNHYNEWEFTYDPLQDQKVMQGGNATTSGINNQTTSDNSSAFGSNIGNSTGSSSTSTTPTTSSPQ